MFPNNKEFLKNNFHCPKEESESKELSCNAVAVMSCKNDPWLFVDN